MNPKDLLRLLRDHRLELLQCETIGWLHMAGKAHPDFLNDQQAGGSTSGSGQWDELRWASNLYSRFEPQLTIGTETISPQKLFEEHRKNGGYGILGLLQAAHAMASGVEKNKPADYQKQPSGHCWLTSAFGHPVQNLLDRPPAILAPGAWAKLEKRIGELFDALAARKKDPADLAAWLDWRDRAVGPSGWIRSAFTSTLAETRVPSNDVTLWDQSFIAAALFKSAVAGAVLSGNAFEWSGNKANTRWRVLTVGFGTEHYETRAVRIGDWTGTREMIAAFFDEVCKFLEVDLAVGSCVYRDELTLSFTFPGQRLDCKGSVDDKVAENLRVLIEARIDEMAQSYAFETPPLVRLALSTRSFIAMSHELAKARDVLEVPVHRAWSITKDDSKGKHVCPVSLVRTGEPSNTQGERKQDVSKTCYNRRTGRRATWERNGGDTIWISEVADENDRVAHLTFSLGLEGWLDGKHVDSLRTQSVVECCPHNKELSVIDADTPGDSLRTHIESFVKAPRTTTSGKLDDSVLKTLNDGFSKESDIQVFFQKIVEDRSDAPNWSSLDDGLRAAWLTHQLFRKNASPGRIHRFWRATQTFFAEALEEFRQLISVSGGTRTQRLCVKLSGDTNGLRLGEVYTGRLPSAPSAPFELLHRESDFVTVCNLARVLRPDGDAAQLKGTQFEATADDGQRRCFTIESVEPAEGVLACYRPLIVLEENPERFRILVPLEAEAACVGHVVTKWRKEMARVWDRLPLRVGVIGFPRKTPFQAVIEATRNVEDDLEGPREKEQWRVRQVEASPGAARLSFERPDKTLEIVEVPTKLADGGADVYYPNLAVVGAERKPHDFTAPRTEGSPVVYRWAPELKPGDEVLVEPSRFASVFLDTTARRFEPVQVHPLSDWAKQQTIWEQVRSAATSLTAARVVEQSLRDARERWTDVDGAIDESVWSDWVRAVLANEWNLSDHELEDLEQAARDGTLERVLDWYLHVLKHKNWSVS